MGSIPGVAEYPSPGGSRMIALDTNILIRVFVDDPTHPGQVAAARRLVASATVRIRISVVVLSEAVWTLRRRFKMPKAGVLEFLNRVLDHPRFDIESRSAVGTALEDYAAWHIDFADCLIAAMNIEAGASTTYTFDRDAAALKHYSRLSVEP